MALNSRSLVHVGLLATASLATLTIVSWITARVEWPNLDGTIGLVAFVLTESGSARYVSVVLLLALAVWSVDPNRAWTQRRRETLALFVIMIVALPTAAFVVEHVVKPTVVTPRPSHERLAKSGAIDDLEAFYALDKRERRAQLGERTSTEAVARGFHLHPRIAAHWLHEAGSTFPSAHALNAYLAAMLLVAGAARAPTRARRCVAACMLAWATLVAWSRVALLVHRPLDVTVGAVLGCAIGAFLATAWWRIANLSQEPSRAGETYRRPCL